MLIRLLSLLVLPLAALIGIAAPASADDISSADNPSAAASTWISVAVTMPRSETRPASRPCSMERVTT